MANDVRDSLVQSIMDFGKMQQRNAVEGKAASGAATAGAQDEKEKSATALEASGSSAATAIREAGALQGQTDDYLRSIASNFGIGANTENEIILGLSNQHRMAAEGLVRSTEEVNKLSSVGVLDNPIQFLINTLQLPEARSAQRTASNMLSVTNTALKSTFEQAQEASKAVNATAAKTNAAITEAKAQEQLQVAAANASAARAQAFQWKAQDVQANMAFDSAQLASMEAQYRAMQTEDSWKLHQQQVAEQRQLHQAQLAKITAESNADTGAYDNMVKTVVNTAQRNGVAIPVMPATAAQFRAQAGFNKTFARQVDELFAIGSRAATLGADILGSNPAEARLVRRGLNIVPTTPGGKVTADLMDKTWDEIHSTGLLDANGAPVTIKVDMLEQRIVVPKGATAEQELAIYNDAVQRKLSQGKASLAPVGAVRSAFRNVDSWPLMQALKDVDTGPTSPMQVGNIQDLAGLGVAAYKAGKININDLGNDMAKFAQLALRKHEQDYEWSRNGITPMKTAMVSTGTKSFDLATAEGQVDFMRYAVLEARPGLLAITGLAKTTPDGERVNVLELAKRRAAEDQRQIDLLDAARKVQGK
jgi:hypothetical protein